MGRIAAFIRRRIALACLSALVFLIAVNLTAYSNILQYNKAHDREERTHQVVQTANQVLLQVVNTQTAQRIYVMTGERPVLERYRAMVSTLPDQVGELRRLTAGSGYHQRRLDTLELLLGQWLAWAERAVQLRYNEGLAAAVRETRARDGLAVTDQILAVLQEVLDEEQRLLLEQSALTAREARWSAWTIVSGSALAFALLLLATWAVLRKEQALSYANTTLARHNEALRTVQRSLAEQRQRYLDLFHFAPDGYLVTDPDGRIQETNVAAARLLGSLGQALVGRAMTDFVDSEQQGTLFNKLDELTRAGHLQGWEAVFKPDSGRPFWAAVSAITLRDQQGRVIGLHWLVRDITERKRAEEALAAREEQIRLLLESTGEGIFAVDLDGACTMINPAGVHLLGYRDASELLGRHVHDLIHYIHADGSPYSIEDCPIVQAMWSNQGVHCEDEVFWRADGTCFDAECYSHPILCNGRTMGAVITLSDISARKQAEAERERLLAQLQEQQRRTTELAAQAEQRARELEATVESIADGFIQYDPAGRIVRMNAVAQNALGYGLADAKEPPLSLPVETPEGTLYPVEHLPSMRALQGETVQNVLMVYRRPEGRKRWVHTSAAPVRAPDGSLLGAVTTFSDVTRLHETEERLRQREQEFVTLVEHLPDVVFRLDRELRHLYINPAIERLFGIPPQQFLGKTGREVGMPANEYEIFEAQCREAIEIGQETQLEFVYGSRQLRTRIIPERALDSASVTLLGITEDITERKQVERLKNEFVSIVSHELRTPLTSIMGSLGLIRGGVVGPLPLQLKAMCDIAYRNTERLVTLINDILDIDKIESGRVPFHLRPVELMALVQEAIETNRPYAERFGVQLVLEQALPGAKAQADPDRLIQVLANLLSNAAKFSPPGERVLVRIARAEGYVGVSVTDRGPGIPEGFRDRIFQKFAQADTSDARAKGGTGLGLSISKAIIERLGGHIGFETESGKGTSFYFKLPEYTG
jgi:PAS domain S-box-containing protein